MRSRNLNQNQNEEQKEEGQEGLLWKNGIRDACSTADILGYFPLLSSILSILSIFIYFHSFWSILSTSIHFHPLWSTFIHLHPLSSIFIHFHPLSSTFIHCIHFHSISSILILFACLWMLWGFVPCSTRLYLAIPGWTWLTSKILYHHLLRSIP